MVPKFEKRVRAFAIDTSGFSLFVIMSAFLGSFWKPLPWIVSSLAFLGFYIIPYFITKGQSFGKRIQRIKVVDLNGDDVNIFILILRELFKLGLSFITFGVYLVIAFFAMSEKTSRTLHDYVFKTKMIDLESPNPYRQDAILGKTESIKKRGIL